MIRFIRAKGFELENTYPGFFLLQAAAGGLFSGVAVLLYTWFQRDLSEHLGAPSDHRNLVFGGLFSLAFFIFLSIGIATVVRSISWIFNWRMNVLARLLVFLGLVVGLMFLIGYLTNERDIWPTRLEYLGGAFLSVLPTASLVGSKVGLGGVFAFGTIRAGNERITSESRLALAAMAPLRIMSFVGLLIWCFVLREYWHYWIEQDFASQWDLRVEYILMTCFVPVYFLSALYLSYRSPRPLILIALCLLLNLPLIELGLFLYGAEIFYFKEITKPYGISCFVLASCFALCVAVRSGVALSQSRRFPGQAIKQFITDPLF